MAILTHPRFPMPIWGVLQTRNQLVQHRPIAVDEPLDFQAVVTHGRLRLDAWLKGPVSHGATVRLHAATTSTTSTFALFARDERPSIVGRLAAPETPS